jgi:dTDP-4-dehydrorhamnose 3,5-epimerase
MDDSKIFIVGANGQLGLALQAKYPNARAVDSDKLDITDARAVEDYDWDSFNTILNAAGYTNVDGAETPEGRITAWRVNAAGPGNLAKAAIKHDLTLVHVSTEYVFDGTKDLHTEDEPVSPLGVYAQAKAAGDIAVAVTPKHYLVRTSWLVGNGPNFVRTMIGLAEKNVSPKVVADQIGRLTFAATLVEAIDHLLSNRAAYGTYNVSNGGDSASWADITRAIFKALGRNDLAVTDITTKEYYAGKPEAAPRPLKSGFDLSKVQATGLVLRDWRADLKSYIKKELAK